MTVFVAIKDYPYETCEILGVYSSRDGAELKLKEEEKEDTSNGYNEFYVEEYEIE